MFTKDNIFCEDMLVDINNQIVTAMLGCYNWYAIGSGASYFSQIEEG